MSGFSFGQYGYLERGLGDHFRFVTWQASARLRKLFGENDRRKLGFVQRIRQGPGHPGRLLRAEPCVFELVRHFQRIKRYRVHPLTTPDRSSTTTGHISDCQRAPGMVGYRIKVTKA